MIEAVGMGAVDSWFARVGGEEGGVTVGSAGGGDGVGSECLSTVELWAGGVAWNCGGGTTLTVVCCSDTIAA